MQEVLFFPHGNQGLLILFFVKIMAGKKTYTDHHIAIKNGLDSL
jgi:hypothetical protein